MREYLIPAAVIVFCLIVGFIFGRLSKKKTTFDGSILIEPSEDGERDKMCFLLNLELDEIGKRKQLIFSVDNRLESKKQQAV